MPVPTQTELDTYLREEDEKWQLGWPLSVKTLDPMLAPSFQNLDPTAPNEWRYAYFYMMRIEGRDIPRRLIRAVDRFRQTLPRELLPLEFLVLMTFSYWAYIRFPVQTTEGFVGRSKLKSHQVPRVELATWLVYSPHFVRVHETLGLALYQHPFRFTARHITSDVDFFGPEARVPTENIAEGEVLAIIDEMGITMADFEKVLPSSWPGTRLDWPGNHGLAPTPQHQRSLALPDVYLVGHPGYQVNTIPKQGRSQYRRKVVVPATMVPPYMASSNEIVRDQNLRALGTAVFAPYKTDYMRRYNQSAETPLFLTAPKLSVTRPYQTFGIGPDDAVDDVIEFPDANAHRMFLAYRNQRVPFEHLFHPRILQALIRHQRTALNAALNRGIGTDQLAVTPHGLVDWPGLERIDPNLADEVPEMILTYYADEITKRLALTVRSQVRVADILVGFDAMLSWDGIHNTKNSHQVPANRMDEPVGYAEHQAAMEAERIRAEQRAAEQRESNAEHQAEAEARENSAERGEAELRDDDVEMMDGTDWQAAHARFQRLRPDDDDIYDADLADEHHHHA
ncbi:hypothetical protein LZ32DRAFT_299564 [Colletotrichum eremochloae]|nr:hypothetical protein LZ32DRAFT_299564 [Colletotrichum eremochloae]